MKKIDETIIISVEHYSEEKLQLNLLQGKYFLRNLISRSIIIREGGSYKNLEIKQAKWRLFGTGECLNGTETKLDKTQNLVKICTERGFSNTSANLKFLTCHEQVLGPFYPKLPSHTKGTNRFYYLSNGMNRKDVLVTQNVASYSNNSTTYSYINF